MPEVKVGKRQSGIAGEYAFSATVAYPDEPASVVTFKGSTFGGPIVMVTDGNPRGVFVSSRVTERIGAKLDAAWVERFFA